MGDNFFNRDGTYGIQGLPRPPNATRRPGEIPYVPNLPVRKEISSLANSNDPGERKQWTLFILALERFKRMPVDDKLSYFQIAGIVRTPLDIQQYPTNSR
jgi:tyrosinase